MSDEMMRAITMLKERQDILFEICKANTKSIIETLGTLQETFVAINEAIRKMQGDCKND